MVYLDVSPKKMSEEKDKTVIPKCKKDDGFLVDFCGFYLSLDFHESTFYHYGLGYQECLAYVLRYLKGSMERENNSRQCHFEDSRESSICVKA